MRVSYQLYRQPLYLGSAATVRSVSESLSSSSSVPMIPRSRAAMAPVRYSPMLVGEVRRAVRITGVSCTLSGGSQCSSAVTLPSKYRHWAAAKERTVSRSRWPIRRSRGRSRIPSASDSPTHSRISAAVSRPKAPPYRPAAAAVPSGTASPLIHGRAVWPSACWAVVQRSRFLWVNSERTAALPSASAHTAACRGRNPTHTAARRKHLAPSAIPEETYRPKTLRRPPCAAARSPASRLSPQTDKTAAAYSTAAARPPVKTASSRQHRDSTGVTALLTFCSSRYRVSTGRRPLTGVRATGRKT